MKVMALLRKKDSHITHNDKAAKFRTSLNSPHPQILHVCKFLRKTYVLFGKITAGCAHYGSQDLELLAINASYLWLVKTEKKKIGKINVDHFYIELNQMKIHVSL